MKKTAFALCFAMLIGCILPVFSVTAGAKLVSVQADKKNTDRGSGELIVYTSERGKTTGTNEWGYEVAVSGGVCTAVGKGNLAIPENGFVLSGHNEEEGGKQPGKWLEENIRVGDYVEVSEGLMITVSDEPIEKSEFYTLSLAFHGRNTARYTDNVIIYDKAGTHTATNNWGYEVTVTGGIVTAMGGNDSLVPAAAGSFVVSGHGKNVDWLKANIKLGMKVTVSDADGKVTFTYDAEAAQYEYEALVSALGKRLAVAKEQFLNIDVQAAENAVKDIESRFAALKAELARGGDGEKFASECSKLRVDITKCELSLSESRTVEYRGVWIRPTQKTAAEVDEYVETLYNNGINTLCIETIYDCTFILPMPKGSLFAQNPKFNGFDVLAAYLESCHKRGMELHLWLPIFYCGDETSSNAYLSVGKKKPEWLSVSSNGDKAATLGYMMLDPSNEEVREFLLSNYRYILENYDIDGFQLDYIRYFESGGTYDLGYNKGALDAFEAKYGVRPKYDKTAPYWKDWVQFRCDQVTEFVMRMRKLVDEVRPGCLLSADVGADPTVAKNTLYQDYIKWLENGWLDILFPMAYGYGYTNAVAKQLEKADNKAYVVVGMGIFTEELGPADMQSQTEDYRVLAPFGNDGECYFESSAFLAKGTGEYLANGVYSRRAITPTSDTAAAAKAILDYGRERIEKIILPAGAVGEESASAITGALSALAATATESGFDSTAYATLLKLVADSDLSDTARTAVRKDIERFAKLYTVMNKDIELPELPDTPDIPSVPEESSKPDTVSEQTNTDDSGDTASYSGSGTMIKVICAVAAAAAVCAAAVVLLRRRKKGGKNEK